MSEDSNGRRRFSRVIWPRSSLCRR